MGLATSFVTDVIRLSPSLCTVAVHNLQIDTQLAFGTKFFCSKSIVYALVIKSKAMLSQVKCWPRTSVYPVLKLRDLLPRLHVIYRFTQAQLRCLTLGGKDEKNQKFALGQ